MVRPNPLGLGLELELAVEDTVKGVQLEDAVNGAQTPDCGTDDEGDEEPPSPIDPFRPSFPRPPTPTPRPPSPSYSHLALSPVAPLPNEPWSSSLSSVREPMTSYPHPFRRLALPTSSLPPRRSSLLPPWPTSYSSLDLSSPRDSRRVTLSHSSMDFHSPSRRVTLSSASLDMNMGMDVDSPPKRLVLDLDSIPKRLSLSLDALRPPPWPPSDSGTDLAMVDHAPLSAVPSTTCPSPVPDLPTRPDYKWQSHSCAPCTLRPLGSSNSAIPHLVQRLVSLVLMPIAIPLLACMFWCCSWHDTARPKWINFGFRPQRSDIRDDSDEKKLNDDDDNDYNDYNDDDDNEPDVEEADEDEEDDEDKDDADEDDDDSPEEATVVHHWWRESLCSVAMSREESWDGSGSCSSSLCSGTPTPPLVKRTEDGLLDW